MNREDFEVLLSEVPDRMIHARTFRIKGYGTMGTLLHGYTCDRDTFHVYLKDGYIHRLVYREGVRDITVLEYDWFYSWNADRLVPDKRVYPESTHPLMARLLRDVDVQVPYLPFDDKRYDRVRGETFHGMIHEELG